MYTDGNINNIKENLTEVWGEEVWPAVSPDWNPFDYFVWGIFELRVNAKSHNKFKDLIEKMKKLEGSLARDTLAKACRSFRSRIEVVFTADGSFIEGVDSQYVHLQFVLLQNNLMISAVLCLLKVVGNEKVGGSRRWHMIDIGLGPW
jgi:hypothetical protein